MKKTILCASLTVAAVSSLAWTFVGLTGAQLDLPLTAGESLPVLAMILASLFGGLVAHLTRQGGELVFPAWNQDKSPVVDSELESKTEFDKEFSPLPKTFLGGRRLSLGFLNDLLVAAGGHRSGQDVPPGRGHSRATGHRRGRRS